MNPGGGRTPDKPDITLTAPEPGDPISSFLNVRVADIAAFYSDAKSKGHNSLPNHLTARPRYGAIYAIPTDTSSRSPGHRHAPRRFCRPPLPRTGNPPATVTCSPSTAQAANGDERARREPAAGSDRAHVSPACLRSSTCRFRLRPCPNGRLRGFLTPATSASRFSLVEIPAGRGAPQARRLRRQRASVGRGRKS